MLIKFTSICYERVDFRGEFSKQQVIDEDTAIRFIKSVNTAKICIDLNR